MTLDFRSIRKEVADELRKLKPDLYEGVVPDEKILKTSNGTVLPYMVLMWTNPILINKGRGIMGVRKDMYSMTCTVHCIAETYEAAVDVHAEVFNHLTGFQPTNSTELRPWGGFSTDTTTARVKPTKFIHSQGFNMYVNTILEV